MPEPGTENAAPAPAWVPGKPDPCPEWMAVDWRAHLHRVELAGATVNYAEVGEGEPILFVHGLGGSWRNWLENLPHFGHGHRAIALDLPGFGESPMPEWPIDVPAYGRLISEFCEALGIGRLAALVGNSLGGFVATEAVLRDQERFERLVLVDAAGLSLVNASRRQVNAIWKTLRLAVPRLASPHRTWFARPRGRQVAFGGVIHEPQRIAPALLQEQIEPGLNSLGLADALASMVGYDTREQLGEIEIPTLIVWGRNDRLVPVRAAHAYQRRIPHARLEILERTGHIAMLERPREFNALLDDFFSEGTPLSS
ncbi:MAG TPA: alpha/beta hydrolase [Solirubrobacterales bacterium]